ncbi:MAG: PIG-L deacetylase family protein [Sphaerochaeta sp.]|nr:PIG-L deacetylase family protein [Sphaerochaeta sp.]
MRTIRSTMQIKRCPRVLALGCHPDDIEFMMGGTLLLLHEAGVELHYCNLSNGCLGTNTLSRQEIIQIREKEGRAAAAFLGATFHPSMAEDLEIFYESTLIRKVAALIRRVEPDILLLPSTDDYMEDHMNTARIGVTAAFSRSMQLYETIPAIPASDHQISLYHALPYGLKNGMNIPVFPEFFVNITSVIGSKEHMLGLHESQRGWLDSTQQVGSYIQNMKRMAMEVGTLSQQFTFSEGWRRHNPLGFSEPTYDPLGVILDFCIGKWK